MISAPYHPIQTRSTLPTGFRFAEFGNNRRGFEIDASSDPEPRCLTQRICVPQGETRSVRTSWLIQSDVVSSANGYEGIAADIQCLVRNGTSLTPIRTYHNDPFSSGNAALFMNALYPDFTYVNFINQIPYNVASEFVDVSLGVRGSSGQLRVASALLRNHYADNFQTIIGPTTWNTFTRQPSTMLDGRLPYMWNNYLDAYSVRIASNQIVKISVESFIDYAVVRDFGAVKVPFALFLIVKMRRSDGTGSDYQGTSVWSVNDGNNQNEIIDHPINANYSFNTTTAYDQVEPIFAFYIGTRTDISITSVEHNGVKFGLEVADVTGTGSQ